LAAHEQMSVVKFFEKLKQQSIAEMLFVHYPEGLGEDDEEINSDRDKVNELLASDALASGIDNALQRLSREDMNTFVNDLGIEIPEGKSRNSKYVLKKELFNFATDKDDLEDFLKLLPKQSMERFAKALEVDPTQDAVSDWIAKQGLSLLLSQFAVAELRQWMGDCGLKTYDVDSKKVLIDAFVDRKNVQVEKKKQKKAG